MKYGYFDETKKEYVITRPDTPGDFAIFMFKNGLTKENILEVGKDLSYPDSKKVY